MTEAARPLNDESDDPAGVDTDDERATRLARCETLLAGAKRFPPLDQIEPLDVPAEEFDAFWADISR